MTLYTDTDSFLKVNLDNLLIQLRSEVNSMWYEFGEAVKIPKEVLDNFNKQCIQEDCIVETFDYWLRHCEDEPTWKDVDHILKLINLHQLALDIERVYIT